MIITDVAQSVVGTPRNQSIITAVAIAKGARIHIFNDTGIAYNFAMSQDEIHTGDILLAIDEKVVGLAYTWPVAITEEHGEFHHATVGIDDLYDNDARVFSDEQIKFATDLAIKLGYPLQEL